MKRLTDNEFHTRENKEKASHILEPRLQQIYDKLFELEDIEEELGIDLITLFKAIKNGIWYWTKNSNVNAPQPSGPWKLHCDFYDRKGFVDEDDWYCEVFRFSEYGKTWALTKEELENGR